MSLLLVTITDHYDDIKTARKFKIGNLRKIFHGGKISAEQYCVTGEK
jgi:hypothetical protein